MPGTWNLDNLQLILVCANRFRQVEVHFAPVAVLNERIIDQRTPRDSEGLDALDGLRANRKFGMALSS